jgi:hypothetical protein
LAAGMEHNPILNGRAEAVLRELARPAVRPDGTAYSPEECLEYAADFMRMTGVPQDLVFPTLNLIGDAVVETDVGRIEDAGIVQHVEDAMRGDVDGYFKSAHAQQEYGKALERLSVPPRDPELDGPILGSPAYREAVRDHDTKRRGEIEAAMREGNGSRYCCLARRWRGWVDLAAEDFAILALHRSVRPHSPLFI